MDLTDTIRAAREAYDTKKRYAEELIRARVNTETTAARYELIRTLHGARAAGMSVSDLARAYGTTNRKTIYDLLAEYAPVEPVAAPRTGLGLYATLEGDRIVARDVPPDAWTYDRDQPLAPAYPTEPWSGWIGLNGGREPLNLNYLLAEKKFGTGLDGIIP